MSRPAFDHPLDTELLDYVEGTSDADSANQITLHLAACLLCRIKHQRLNGAPPMEPIDVRGVVTPDFATIDLVPGEPTAQPGQLWLTNADDATIVLVRSIRTEGHGVVVVPVTLDVEAADDRTRTLDESASPLGLPLAIFDDLAVSLPLTALAERIVLRADVDLMALSDGDEGVSRGTRIRSAADPRLELRQYLVDRLTALEPYDMEQREEADGTDGIHSRLSRLQDELLFRRGPNCDVQDLPTLPLGTATPAGWVGIARVLDFTIRLIVVETPHGLHEATDFAVAQALVTRLAASAMAVCTPHSDVADVYDAPALFRGFQLPEGTRSSDPIISGLWLPDAVAKYLEQKRVVLSTIGISTQHAQKVDAAAVLKDEAARAIDATVKRAPRLGAEKKDGYLQLPRCSTEVAEVLARALHAGFDPQWIADAITGDDT